MPARANAKTHGQPPENAQMDGANFGSDRGLIWPNMAARAAAHGAQQRTARITIPEKPRHRGPSDQPSTTQLNKPLSSRCWYLEIPENELTAEATMVRGKPTRQS